MAPPEFVSTTSLRVHQVSPVCDVAQKSSQGDAPRELPILFSAPMVRALLDGTKTQTRRVVKGLRDKMWIEATAAGGFAVCYDGEPSCGTGVWEVTEHSHPIACPYGQPSDRLWVRETYLAWGRWETRYSAKKGRDEWHFVDMTIECGKAYLYDADHSRPQPLAGKRDSGVAPKWWKRPAIFMPRAACRIQLEVTGLRVERLQDISEADADAEGCERLDNERDVRDWKLCHRCGGTRLYTAYAGGGACPDTDCQECDTYVKRYRHLWEAINGPDSWTSNPWVWVVTFRRVRAGDSSFITTKEIA